MSDTTDIQYIGDISPKKSEILILVQATILSWHNHSVGKRRKKAWNVAPLSLFWIIWEESKRGAFENVELSDGELKFSFFV